jgi:serine/threonine protein phosphatase PrpC
MPSRRNCYYPALLLAVTALCVIHTGCGKKGPASHSAETGKLTIGKCTLIGNFPEFNDDAIAVEDLSGSILCLAADGMGGKVGGKILGQIAAKRAFEVVTGQLGKELPQATTPDENRTAIRRAIVAANEDVIATSGKDPDLRNMGTTLVLGLWRQGDGMYIAGVGDSRAYLIRDERIEQLTVDHTLARALVENKTITADEARTHRFRNVLWKFLGSKEVGQGPEIKFVPLQNRDRILLCTNGLHGAVPDERILHCMRQFPEVQKCADALGQLAVDSGSRGNVSCIVIEMVANR